MKGNTYIFNSAAYGGALYSEESNYSIIVSDDFSFSEVSFNLDIVHQYVTYFINNSAKYYGGAVYLYKSFATLQGIALVFERNMTALAGGAMYNTRSHITLSATNSFFISNMAYKSDNDTSKTHGPKGGGALFSLNGSLHDARRK